MQGIFQNVPAGQLASAASRRYLAPQYHHDDDFEDKDDNLSTAGRTSFWRAEHIAALKAAIEAEPDLDNICWMNVAKAVTGRNAKQCR
jgi:hypothetical protein